MTQLGYLGVKRGVGLLSCRHLSLHFKADWAHKPLNATDLATNAVRSVPWAILVSSIRRAAFHSRPRSPYGSTPKVVRLYLLIGTGACPICDFVAGVFLIVVCLAVVAWMQRHPSKNRWDEPDKRP